MQVSIKTKKDGSVGLRLDAEAARAMRAFSSHRGSMEELLCSPDLRKKSCEAAETWRHGEKTYANDL